MELSDKQMKALAEFLGVEQKNVYVAELRENFQPVIKLISFQDWLIGNDGQAALMDMMDERRMEYRIKDLADEMAVGKLAIVFPSRLSYCGRAETRQEAIIHAILDMLGA